MGDSTIYTSQLKDRTESSASKFHVGMPLLSSIPVTEAMQPTGLLFDVDDTVGESVRALVAANRSLAVVAEGGGVYRGSVTMDMLLGKDEEAAVGGFAVRTWPVVSAGVTMDAATEAIVESGAMWVPVLDDQRHVVGVMISTEFSGPIRRRSSPTIGTSRA